MALTKIASRVVVATLLAGCARVAEPPRALPPVEKQASERTQLQQISVAQAIAVLQARMKINQVQDIDCLGFMVEDGAEDGVESDAKAELWEIAVPEIHNEKCGGDPAIFHIRDRYRVSASGNVMIDDVANGEYIPY